MQLPVLLALLVLLLVAGRRTAALLRGSGRPYGGEGRVDGHIMLEGAGRYQRGRTEHGLTERAGRSAMRPGHLRDPRHKEKFIKHLTGPLYFNPKCRKHFHRLYHNTRDCTVPDYYKRCARLLIRLANSPRCTER